MRILLIVFGVALAGANLYQAITGKRLSKRPSRRTDEQMQRQSALAFAFLTVLTLLLIFGG